MAIELARNEKKTFIQIWKQYYILNSLKLECWLAGKEQKWLLSDHYKPTKYQNITRDLSIVFLTTLQGYNSNNSLTLSPSAGIFATCLFIEGYKLY